MVDQVMAIVNAIDKLEEHLKTAMKRVANEKVANKKQVLEAEKNAIAANLESMRTNYETTIYHISVTFSHEICHLSTGFLTGANRPRTPEGVTAADHAIRGYCGEHGWAWEYKVFHGCTFFFIDSKWTNSPLDVQQLQSGTPYAHDDDSKMKSWYKYKPGFVSSMIKLGKSPQHERAPCLHPVPTNTNMPLRFLPLHEQDKGREVRSIRSAIPVTAIRSAYDRVERSQREDHAGRVH